MPGEMGCAENEETMSASAASSLFPPVENCIWVDVNSPHSSSSERSLWIDPTASNQNLAELTSGEVLALPTSCQPLVESSLPDAHASHQSFSVLDQAHVTNIFAIDCSPPSGSPVAYSKMHVAHAKMHVPSLYSPPIMVGSSLLGNAAMYALPWFSSVSLSSGNDATPTPTSSASKAPPTRLEFMQSFVNTLLPQLKRIHSQSSSTSLLEKFSAVRLAADMSLAISAGGNSTWSQALFQELANSCSNKVGARKSNARKSSTLRGRIYTSILRRNTRRGGSLVLRMRASSHASNCKGTNSLAFPSISRDCYHASLSSSAKCLHESLSSGLPGSLSRGSSHAMCCKNSCNSRIVRRKKRVTSLKHFSYVKILRNSRSAMKLPNVKSPADPAHEASKAHVPSISKEHIASLSRLVPGGRTMDVPLLFQEAADYIRSLQMQVEVLQSLSHSV